MTNQHYTEDGQMLDCRRPDKPHETYSHLVEYAIYNMYRDLYSDCMSSGEKSFTAAGNVRLQTAPFLRMDQESLKNGNS